MARGNQSQPPIMRNVSNNNNAVPNQNSSQYLNSFYGDINTTPQGIPNQTNSMTNWNQYMQTGAIQQPIML